MLRVSHSNPKQSQNELNEYHQCFTKRYIDSRKGEHKTVFVTYVDIIRFSSEVNESSQEFVMYLQLVSVQIYLHVLIFYHLFFNFIFY